METECQKLGVQQPKNDAERAYVPPPSHPGSQNIDTGYLNFEFI